MHDGALEMLHGWDFSGAKTLQDVGCGSGQTAIPASKMGLKVTGIDIAENLINHARKMVQKANLDTQFNVGDAENLPYEDNSFDAAITMVGAMFAPRPDQIASELSRDIKRGDKLCTANWTATSMLGQMFKAVAEIASPPPGFIPPVLWGDEDTVTERLNEKFSDIKLSRKSCPQWYYPF